ncbi:carbamoyl phosphate synthase small subunit [Candidatus Desantisbacteria bacterium CG1_02_38_46]|uniref:Carbamoyl phosphate synthase small chain n=3 Tax=unclassified Candidatus Desantisiibacteriota TaxID=3106372 RepID=A0A2H9PCX0_9BACT|nr:MAG: carbamoyl phosphate synthase small subunit [Candidatus Desantisbacteria bacterium CG1_02_38_46]PIU51210.1 MAG: carbamoyl phosphate synthase small subunit [Candidatus Desantisbacteria bacterium CG07_land_8_20_14_0_80_39_15]PIZ16043.1 MAG: carbamoyl phosphate synthase small subunit [Candidatus Desantisbacteria bacterium CG_4_10_14_0_8_um_filter_39_17]
MKTILALEDGTVFKGKPFGATGERFGEIVFNTSMTGYQEILTDPSYKGQIVCMTYPLIGNYGVSPEDFESRKPFVEGFVVKECSRIFSNWRGKISLDEFLKEHDILGIEGIDTRELTCHIRSAGAMKSVISTEDLDVDSLISKVKASHGLIGRDLVKEVTCEKTYKWEANISVVQSLNSLKTNLTHNTLHPTRYKVVVLDCGTKHNILNSLITVGCDITAVPARTSAKEILKYEPDGILLSNGPGDPAAVPYVVDTVKDLIRSAMDDGLPMAIFGICLGHQILGLALGGKTYKLKFGHHGGNHPVKDLRTGRVAITAQNHGFCVDIESLNKDEIEITHINLYDNTLEGMRHKKLPIFSVQYHPESSPGPHDAGYLFEEFVQMMGK